MEKSFFNMPFNCFKHNSLFSNSKRYHTAAKQSAAFFDSSFNYIKQNSQVVISEPFAHGAKRIPNPHPVNSISANYLQIDYSTLTNNNDENKQALKNPINIVLPYNQDSFILSVHKNDYQQIIKKLPMSQQPITTTSTPSAQAQTSTQSASVTPSSNTTLVSKFNTSFQKNAFHTQATKQTTETKSSSSSASSPTLVESPLEQDTPKYFEPVFEEPQEQTDETFLYTQVQEIERYYNKGEYERINSYYMALKRNGIVPPRDIYAKVLDSISKRTIDDTLDDQLSVMLNVYQDMISNRIKPDLNIYSIVISQLLQGSIKAAYLPDYSSNGADFFKIAIDIFNASNCTHIQQFDSSIFDQILIGMNLYPGFVNHESLTKILDNQPTYNKSHIYYSSLINYCKVTSDSSLAIRLYEDFKTSTLDNESLNQHQFIIYASFISTLIETNQVSLATKFLDKLLTSIKSYEEYESKVNLLLTSYLLTLSKQNCAKAVEIWAQFNRIDWIPEFSYEFYLHLLRDSFADYETSLKLYNYMVALPRTKSLKEYDMDTLLITPPTIDSLSEFLMIAIDKNDKSTVLKLLKESFIRGTTFNIQTYGHLFRFINNDELTTRIINSHGLTMKNGFEFLTYLSSNIANLPVYAISRTEFFKKLMAEYSLEKTANYFGFYQVIKSVLQTQDNSIESLEFLAPLIIELHDVHNYYMELDSRETLEFKNEITQVFTKLMNELNTENASTTALEAIRLLN